MRFIATLLVCAGVLLTAAGCDPVTDRKYYRDGAGIELYTADGATQTELQNLYIDYICQQAGISVEPGVCRNQAFTAAVWRTFFEAGMNDIDQRCDSFLAWLDAQRRDRQPVLNQLAAMNTAAHNIMAITGANTTALDVVTAAYGLAVASYSNWNSRLLLAVNQSTVQEIVYSRQQQYRNAVRNEVVSDRPRAMYLLRNYLRICMPGTIEAEVNISTTLVQRGAPNAAMNNPVVRPVKASPLTSNQKVGQQPPRPEFSPTPGYADIIKNYDPKVFTPTLVKPALANLCVKDVNSVGVDTMPLVQVYQMEKGMTPTGKLTLAQIQSLKGGPSCPADRLNYFEAHGMSAGLVTVSNIELLSAGLPAGEKIQGTPTIDDVRTKILPKVRSGPAGANLTLKSPELSGQFTRELMTQLLRLKMRPTQ